MITREQFRKGNFRSVNSIDSGHPVLIFLKKNPNRAYKIAEIAKAVRKNTSTVRATMRRYIKQGAVERKSPYYIKA